VNYARLIEFINPYNPGMTSPWVMGGWNTTTLSGLAKLSNEIGRQSAMIGYINAFGLMTLVSAVAIPVAFFVRPTRSPVES
jgi:DHA2 family multidrug resistance protein